MNPLLDWVWHRIQFLARALRYGFCIALYHLASVLPRSDRVWIFTSKLDQFSGNTKYLFLHANQRDDGVRPIWITDDPTLVQELHDEGFEAYQRSTLRGQYYLLRGGFTFLTHAWHQPLCATGGSTVVQLWHAINFKLMGFDQEEHSYFGRLIRRHITFNWDKFAVPNTGQIEQTFRSAFGVTDSQLMVTGYPRNDAIRREFPGERIGVDDEEYRTIRSLAADSMMVFYTPTWRRSFGGEADGAKLDGSVLPLDRLERVLADNDAYMLVSLHPNVDMELNTGKYDRIILLSNTVDIYPLMKFADTLVTDYSSIFYDYMLLDRPILFYAFDQAQYEATRGVYFDYDEFIPGPKATTQEELLNRLERVLSGEDDFKHDRRELRNKIFRQADANASRRVYERVVAEIDQSGETRE